MITDDLEAPLGDHRDHPGPGRHERVGAGGDLLLYAKSDGASERAFSSLVTPVKSGQLEPRQLAGRLRPDHVA